MKTTVLITGAAGFVGGHITPILQKSYLLRLLDIRPVTHTRSCETVCADITSFEDMLHACEGVDTVIHLAAEPSIEAPFNKLLQPNIVGVYNVFEAAFRAGCSRVIFASSINAVMGYPLTTSITHDMPANPVNVYGATKCFGEAIGRLYANRGLSVICVRIGQIRVAGDSFKKVPGDPYAEAWISARDLAELFLLCVSANNIDFDIFHALGRHDSPRLSIEHTCDILGFTPQDGSM